MLGSGNEDPTTWFNEIARWNTRFGNVDRDFKKKEWVLKAHVLRCLPAAYDVLVPTLNNVQFSFEEYERMITDHWKTKLQGKSKGSATEMALAFFRRSSKATATIVGSRDTSLVTAGSSMERRTTTDPRPKSRRRLVWETG